MICVSYQGSAGGLVNVVAPLLRVDAGAGSTRSTWSRSPSAARRSSASRRTRPARQSWRRPPYQGSAHDRAALAVARRVLVVVGAGVTVLHVTRPDREGQGARELVESVFASESRPAITGEPAGDGKAGQVTMKMVEHRSPAEAALAESAQGYDLVIVGVGREWGLAARPLGIGIQPERLIQECSTSILVVRGPGEARAGLVEARIAGD